MAVTFPSSPTTNQQVTDSVTGAVWQWDGTKWVALNSGQIYLPISNPAFTGTLTGPTELLPGNLSSTLLIGSNTTAPYAGWSVPNAGSSLITAGCHWNASGNLIADATSGTQFSMGSSSNGFTFWVGQGTWTVGSTPSSALLGMVTISNTGLNVTNGNATVQNQLILPLSTGASQIWLGDPTTPWGSITSYAANSLTLGGGLYRNTTQWIPTATSASLINCASGYTIFYNNSGLTVGTAFTPTYSGQISATGLWSLGALAAGAINTSCQVTIYTSSSLYGILVQNTSGSSTGNPIIFNNSAGGTAGTITTTNTTTAYNTSSDGRLKTNLAPFIEGRRILDQLPIQSFDWISNGERSIGVVAQDVRDIYPNAITDGRGEMGEENFVPHMVDYSKYVPLLIQALQEAHRRIDALEARLNYANN